MADEEDRPAFERCRANKPERVPAFLLAKKRGLYRETFEYQQAELKERMRTKPRPAYRPMVGR